MSKVSPEPATGCWLWEGFVGADGYAIIYVGPRNKHRAAHRVAWTLFHGEIPQGMLVCHRCDVTDCVNPGHLFLGTPADNSADMKRKGRSRAGERSPVAKLTEEQVLEIRACLAGGEKVRSLAGRFGTTVSAIKLIKQRRTWRHLLPVGQVSPAAATSGTSEQQHE